MIGLCIGTGEWYRVAVRAAARMEQMTGVPCRVIERVDGNLAHASWHKLNLLRDYPGETLFIFDADIWCLAPWDPRAYTATGLAMVRDRSTFEVRVECALYHIPPDRYHNAGLMIADERAREVFAAAKRLHPRYGRWLEQTAVNHEAHARGFPVQAMPFTLNSQIDAAEPVAELAASPAVNLHFSGRKTVARLHEIFDALEGVSAQTKKTT